MSFIIATDSTCDLPEEYIAENDLKVLNLFYTIKGVTYGRDNFLETTEFYRIMREGNVPKTSQVNIGEAKDSLLEMSKENKNILYLAFSSGLSGTYNSVSVAANELMEEDPSLNIIVIDTLCASMGEGFIVYKAVELKKEGKSIEEVAEFVRTHIHNVVHMFTVDDLNHLWRGGRLSKGSAVVGSVLNIKPIIHVDDEGHLINIDKVRGRKKSLIALADYMENRLGSYAGKNDIFFISHGDCLDDALFLRDEIVKRFKIDKSMINFIGPTVGAHSGPVTVALFFFGDNR